MRDRKTHVPEWVLCLENESSMEQLDACRRLGGWQTARPRVRASLRDERQCSGSRQVPQKERHRRNAVSQNHPGWAADGCQGRNGAVGSRKGPGRQLGGLEITPVRIMGLSVTAGTGNEVGKDRQRYAQK